MDNRNPSRAPRNSVGEKPESKQNQPQGVERSPERPERPYPISPSGEFMERCIRLRQAVAIGDLSDAEFAGLVASILDQREEDSWGQRVRFRAMSTLAGKPRSAGEKQ